jgi:quinol monooxygenase YgiN
MVCLTVLIRASTEQVQTLVTALRTLMRGARIEAGCLECDLWTAACESGSRSEVHYHERWVNEPAMERRVRSDAFTKLLEVLEAAPEPPAVFFDFVLRRQGLEYVEEVRGAVR